MCVNLSDPLAHEKITMNKLTLTLGLSLVALLVGCNTVRGMGQDIQKAGEKIEDVVKKK